MLADLDCLLRLITRIFAIGSSKKARKLQARGLLQS